MRRPLLRPWLRGPRPRRGPVVRAPRGWGVVLSTVLGVGLALCCIRGFDAQIRPVVTDMAQARANNAVTRIIDDTVNGTLSAQAVAYSDIVSLQKDDSGRITAMTTSTAKINALRTQILDAIVEQVNSLDTEELGVPLGNLTGLVTASGRGPLLPVRILSVAAPEAAFRNVFTSAGINQTLHQVVLDVSVPIKLLIPGGTVETTVTAEVGVAETVIVGQVPDAYLQFGASS